MFRKLPKLLTFLFIILSFFLSRPPKIQASILFQDNFDSGNSSNWTVARNMQWSNPSLTCFKDGQPTNWEIKDGRYGIVINGPGCVTEAIPIEASWDNSWNNYIFETDVIFVAGLDGNIAFRYVGSPNYDWYGYHFQVRADPANSSITLQRVLNTNIYPEDVSFPFQRGVTYHLKIVVNGEHLQLFIDNILVMDYADAGGRFTTGKIALQASVGGDPSSEVWFDNVVVRSIDELEPPEPEVKTPLILLPGLGASWDTSAMLTGGSGDDWKPTPFVKVYDNFRNTFVDNAGYIENQDYFEFYYDWRQPLDSLADQFKTYLETVVLVDKPEGTKVNLVGHSMGGLLAKTYAHKYGLDKVSQIVTIGSPHQGAVSAWQVWIGAEQGDRWSWGWLALELYLHLHQGKYASPVDAVHGLAPSVNNLMPTFDFAKEGDTVVPVNSMSDFNNYLNDLKNNLSDGLKNILVTIAGHDDDPDNDTARWVNLTDRSLADQLLGKWLDGKPLNWEFTPDGDLTVLELSALVDGATSSAVINSNHVDLLANQASIQAILNALNLSEVEPDTDIVSPLRNPSVVFLLHSPAQIKITAPDGTQAGYQVAEPMSNSFYSEADKLLIIYNADNGDYSAEVIGTDTGTYQLEIGQLTDTENVWTTLAGETTGGEVDQYLINFSAENPDDQPIVDPTGKTQVNMAAEIFNQINDEVNGLSLEKKKARYKNPVLIYLAKINGLILADINQIENGNYENAKVYTRSLMAGAYNLRQKIDGMSEKAGLSENLRAEWKNQSDLAGKLLIDAYVNVFNQSDSILKLKGVNKHISVSQDRNYAAATYLDNIDGENTFAGNAYQLSLDMLEDARAATSSSLPTAWAKSVVSRILALEATKLIN